MYQSLTTRLGFWKAKNLWNKIDKKAKHVDYKNKPCAKLKAMVIGAGPCGLRTAIELALLGAEVIVVEKRDSFSRNNVLHLWPFLIVDLKNLGAKIFYGKFCAGSLDHISIRKLQCILLKVCLILGVQIFPRTSFEELLEPSEGRGWRVKTVPHQSFIDEKDINIIVGADGRRNLLKGFKRKEFRGKLAIGITVNFVNRKTQVEAAIEEISGVAFIYNQQFFQELKDKTGIDLENIVYYKDDTHYFVMTAKKNSLIKKGVIIQDNPDAQQLLAPSNVSHAALCEYAKQAVDFSTHYKLPHHEFALNHYGKEDVAMFDFTSMHAAENASRIVERKGKRLLMGIVGDTLIEPFWPTGSGCARGFLSAFDAAWAARAFGLGKEPLDIIHERECILKLLAQTNPGNMLTNYQKYSIDPATRYSNWNTRLTRKEAVRHLYDKSDIAFNTIDYSKTTRENSPIYKVNKQVKEDTGIDAYKLLQWCQEQTKQYPGVKIFDMALSWKNGLGFCAIIHRYRPDILNFFDLDENDSEKNCQLAFDTAEEHLGIPPKMSGKDFTRSKIPDRLTVISYLSLYYDTFKGETPAIVGTGKSSKQQSPGPEFQHRSPIKPNKMSIIAKLSRKSKKKAKALESRRAKQANKENLAVNGHLLHSKTGEKRTRHGEKESLLQTDSDSSLSPEHKPISFSGKDTSPRVLRSSNQSAVSKHEANVTDVVDGKVAILDKDAQSGPMFVITGAQTGESETDGDESVQSKRKSKINMIAESVFGVPTIQAVAEAQANLSESELCWFCKRQVYVMERMSAEGKFFHRQCFRCSVCKCNLLLGNYVFDNFESNDGRFYCKLHYNRMVYATPKANSPESKQVQSPTRAKKTRPVTQIVQPELLEKAFQEIADAEQNKKVITPQLETPSDSQRSRSKSEITNSPKIYNNDAATEEKASPYEKFEAKTLVRHPSLTRQQSKELSPVRDLSPRGHLMHAESSPALQKLFNEDNEFGEDLRRRSELKDDEHQRKRHLRKLQPSIELRRSIEKDLLPQEVIIPGRPCSPKLPKRLGLTKDLEAGMGVSTSKNLVPISVEINIESESGDHFDEGKVKIEAGDATAEVKPKKKKYVLKRKKVKKPAGPTIIEDEKEHAPPEEERQHKSEVTEFVPVKEAETEPDSVETMHNDSEEEMLESTYEIINIERDVNEENLIMKDKKHIISGKENASPQETNRTLTSGTVKEEKKKEKKFKLKKKPKEKKVKKSEKEKKPEKDRKSERKIGKPAIPDGVAEQSKVDEKAAHELATDDSDESDQEETRNGIKEGFFSNVFGTKPKRVLKTAEELEEEEKKRKRKEMKKIQQTQTERRLKRLWEAQSIQRKLNEVEVRQMEIDDRAKVLERKLRMPYLKPEEEGPLMMDWFQVVNDKNILLRFESELVIQANNIQLEDRQARLENDIRALLTSDYPKDDDQEWIDVLTKELVDTVEERNNLVEMLEQDRLRELEEDKNLHLLMANKAEELGMDRLI